MDTNKLKRFATEARNILMQGVAHRLQALGFKADGTAIEEPQQFEGGATFMGETVAEDFYQKWLSLAHAIKSHSLEEIAEEAAYTWFNRLVAIRIMVKNGLIAPVLQYESEGVHIPLLVSEARQGRIPEMKADELRKLEELLIDDSQTAEQFRILIVAFCHANPVIYKCFGHITDYTELLLPTNILAEGGFVDMLNNTEFISEEDYHSPELIGWLYQFYISEKKDDVFASFKKGKKAEAKDIPAATQIFTPNWIVKYMVQNTIGRIYLDNNPYEDDIQKRWKYLVEPTEPTPEENILHYDDLKELKFADLACGSGHILNEGFDILYDLYLLEGYSRKQAIENIFKYNLTGVDIDTRAKQLAQFALLLKACQKDSSFADAHLMPKILDMPEPYPYKESLRDTLPSFFIGGNQQMIQEVIDAINLMDQAKNLGSIMKFNISENTRNAIMIRMEEYEKESYVPEAIRQLMPYMSIILVLTKKYSAMVANPPYMGRGNMNTMLSFYLDKVYPISKQDLFATFMVMMLDRTIPNGLSAFITMESWMFLSSFEKLRQELLDHFYLFSLGHFGWHIIGIAFGTAMTIIQKCKSNGRRGEYSYLTIDDIDKTNNIPFVYPKKDNGRYSIVKQESFEKIPGYPIGYWVSEKTISIFNNSEKIKDFADVRHGMSTGKNELFVRFWHEVGRNDINTALKKQPESLQMQEKYVPYNKGGDFRKWYGNATHVLRYDKKGQNQMSVLSGHRHDGKERYFQEGITWSFISSHNFGVRYTPTGFSFDVAGSSMFMLHEKINYVLAVLCSKIGTHCMAIMNPTFNFQVGNLKNIPIIQKKQEQINNLAHNCILISREDWDSHETSWDFQRNELLTMDLDVLFENVDWLIDKEYRETGRRVYIEPAGPEPEKLEWCYTTYCQKWERLFDQLHRNEEELNRQFIEIYGLQDELTPDVPMDEITILQQGEISIKNNQIVWHPDVIMKQLISYAVGCMMGRYSIDKPGLILANQGDGIEQFNKLVPNSRFEVDDDGIVPLMSAQSDFADNATVRFKHWLSVTFGEETLVENLNFIESALGKSIDDYFVKDFWKDHKKMYQNRPIYWLFSSKKGAFQCIVYMHRMDAYTAERIRTKYLLPHIEWLLQKQSEMEAEAANLSARERKQLDNIVKQIAECREYHDRLHVIADQQIAFDLDDGVLVNYAKFGDVLAKIK